MKALAGEEVKCYFVGNAPMGHLPLSSGGAQFFNKVQIMQDDFALEPSSGADDRIWVTKEEIADYIKDTDLCELTSRMLGE
mmetsp:Transcript_27304/g.68753  ORF Transcript_27304/g.68753 Transcript_27304/m.68753 type:complete len:81 (+) Transcript_27304:387-629(+)